MFLLKTSLLSYLLWQVYLSPGDFGWVWGASQIYGVWPAVTITANQG